MKFLRAFVIRTGDHHAFEAGLAHQCDDFVRADLLNGIVAVMNMSIEREARGLTRVEQGLLQKTQPGWQGEQGSGLAPDPASRHEE